MQQKALICSFLFIRCFPKFRWVELLLTNSNLIDYVYAILREKRVSLNDPIILTFIELYFPKVNSNLFDFRTQFFISQPANSFFLFHLLP